MEAKEQLGVLGAWSGPSTQLLTSLTHKYQEAFSSSPCLRVPPGTPPTQCAHFTDVGKPRPTDEAMLAYTLSGPQPCLQSPSPLFTAVCPQASCSPSLG